MEQYRHSITISPLEVYFHEISHFPYVSHGHEKELAIKIQVGDREALRRLVSANLRFAVNICRRYTGMGLTVEDLISASSIALLKAAKRFTPDNGRFIDFASWWIRQELMAEFARIGRSVTIPYRLLDNRRKLLRRIDKLEQKTGESVSIEKAASELDLPIEHVDELLGFGQGDESLDRPAEGSDDPDMTEMDMLVYEDDQGTDEKALSSIISKELAEAMLILSPRERDILRLTFGIGNREVTIEETALMMGVSPNKIRFLRKNALRKLRECQTLRDLVV